jgi:branched-chain amino acid transport system permease protein
VTTVAQSASPASNPTLLRRLRLVGFSLIGIVLYYLVLTLFLTLANSGTDPNAFAKAQTTAAQQTANALTLGAIYALIALGYTMVYGIIELINFAHGDVFMVGSFVGLWTLTSDPFLHILGLNQSAIISNIPLLALILGITFAVAMAVMGIINVAIERFAYRPLRHAPRVAPLITAIGMSLILQNVVQIIVGTGDRPVPQIFPTDSFTILGAQIRYLNVFIFVVALLLMYILQTFVSRSRLGRAMRATAQDQQAAQLMGVDLNQTIALTFLIGGALAGAAGVFQGQYRGFVRFDDGFNAGLKAFTAAVLGGIGNLTGAALGGFLIAFLEVFAAANGQQRWSQAIVFVVLIVVLVFRPSGLLGQQIGERA